MEKDIKETLEVVDALELVLVTCIRVLKDGKVNLNDVPLLLNVLREVDKLVQGFKDLNEIPKELSDLDQDELIQLGLKVYNVIEKIKKEVE